MPDLQDEIDRRDKEIANLRRHVVLLQEEGQQLLDEVAVLRYRLEKAGGSSRELDQPDAPQP